MAGINGPLDPGGAILAENLLAGAPSAFEEQDNHRNDGQDEHGEVSHRKDSQGSVEIANGEKLPTFYAALRLAPIGFVLPASAGLNVPILTEYLKTVVCEVSNSISANVCAHIGEPQYKNLGDKVATDAAYYQLFMTLIGSSLPIIFSLFVGGWSDKFGRKLPMMIPFLGYFVGGLYLSVITNYRVHPLWLLIPPFLSNVTGGWTVQLMAIYSYIGDFTTDRTRAMNIAIYDGMLILWGNVFTLAGGYLFAAYGFPIPMYIQTVMHAFCFFYIMFVIHDRIRPPKSTRNPCAEFFAAGHIWETILMLIAKRLGDTRLHIHIVLWSLFIFTVCDSGEDNITQFFLEFQPFSWTLTFFTVYSCVYGVFRAVVVVTSMVVFRKYFHVRDSMIAFLGAFSALLYFFGFGIARTSWLLFAASCAGSLRPLMIVATRSMLSAMVQRNEIGKMMSFISTLQAVTPFIGASIFNTIFSETRGALSGMCFLVAAFLTVGVMAAFGYVDVERRKSVYKSASPPRSLLE